EVEGNLMEESMNSLLCKIFGLLCIVIGLTAPFAGAQELVVWHPYQAEEKVAFEKVVAAYNASKDGKIKITPLAVPFHDFPDRVRTGFGGGKGPDIFVYPQDQLGGWIDAGNIVEPLASYIESDTKARYIPTTLEAMSYKGGIYGLPLNYKVITMIYNTK